MTIPPRPGGVRLPDRRPANAHYAGRLFFPVITNNFATLRLCVDWVLAQRLKGFGGGALVAVGGGVEGLDGGGF